MEHGKKERNENKYKEFGGILRFVCMILKIKLELYPG